METYLDKSKAEYNFAKQNYTDFGDDQRYFSMHAFWLSQSVEMAIRHIFDMVGASQPKTHDTDQLIRIANEQDVDLFLTRYIAEHAEMFTLWGERKDDVEYEIERQKVERAIKEVSAYLEMVEIGSSEGKIYTNDLSYERTLRHAVDILKASGLAKHIRKIILYGSVSRGEQHAHSDIDIAIELTANFLEKDENQTDYFLLCNDVRGCHGFEPEVDLHVVYPGWEESNDCFNKGVSRDGKIIWENTDYAGGEK